MQVGGKQGGAWTIGSSSPLLLKAELVSSGTSPKVAKVEKTGIVRVVGMLISK